MVIGILGKKRSGKDTSGDYLINKKNFIKYSFAIPLKRGCMELFGLTEEQVFGDLKEVIDPEWGVTPRTLLQIVGTELLQYDVHNHIPEFNSIGRLIWVKRFKQWYRQNKDLNVVICDVRFQHEVDAILDMGGQVWRVERPGLESSDTHSSEMDMDNITNITTVVKNDGTLQDLYNKIDNLI